MGFPWISCFGIEKEMKRSFLHRLIPFGILLLGVGILLMSSEWIRFRIDLTGEKRFSLHPSTQKLLEELEKKARGWLIGGLKPGMKLLLAREI